MSQSSKHLFILCFFISTLSYSQKNSITLSPGEDIIIDSLKFLTYEGQIEVPMDSELADRGVIQLPVFIIKSSNSNPDEPIFWLDGGPGGSNIISRNKIALTSAANTLKNHDFVCIGYRGVDGSVVLSSKKISKAFKGKQNKLLSDKSLNNIEAKIKLYNIELLKKGIDVNNFTIMNVIEDLEFARKQLGYNKINLLSLSYGTRVALLYSYKYPKIINRTLMIGACPPGYFLAKPEQAEEVLDKYDKLFKEQDTLNEKMSIKEAIKISFEKMPKRWSIFTLDPDKIKSGTINAMYNVNFSVMVFGAYFKAAKEGDYSGLYMLQKLSEMNIPKVVGDIYSKTVSADIQKNIDYRSVLRNTKTVLGPNVSLLYGGTAEAWPIKPIPEEFRRSKKSDTQTLIISGDLDFRTPPSIVNEELMPFLTNGYHMILKNSSHIDILTQTMKHPTLLQQYFDNGNIDKNFSGNNNKIDFKPKQKISKTMIFLMGIFK